jgi:hypothetical protein
METSSMSNEIKETRSANPQQRGPAPNWKPIQDFTHKETGLTFRVTRSDAWRPGYSFEFGRLGTDPTKIVRFCRVRTDTHNGQAVLVDKVDSIIAELAGQMIAFVEDEAQKDEDARLERARENEQRSIDRDKGSKAKGIKTIAKKENGK